MVVEEAMRPTLSYCAALIVGAMFAASMSTLLLEYDRLYLPEPRLFNQ